MLKVFSSELIRAADRYTIEHEPIHSVDLMERAAKNAFLRIKELFIEEGTKRHFSIFCGVGNNGGDGLVIARKLIELGQDVEVYIVKFSRNCSIDFKANLDRLENQPIILTKERHQFTIKEHSLVIDAIFGTGLTRVVEGFSAEIINTINDQKEYTISIDIPSGLYADSTFYDANQVAVYADLILSFHFPKLAFLFPENAKYVREWQIISTGLHQDFIDQTECKTFLVSISDIRSIVKNPDLFSHKGDHGRALLLSGSKGKVGAAVLAAKACLRSGAGLLSIQVPQCAYSIIQTAVPEAMAETDTNMEYLSELKSNLRFNSLGIGPGIGQEKVTQTLLKLLIQQCDVPMVIDADALNILSENKTWLNFLPKGSILTPHMKEFERLAGPWTDPNNRLELSRNMAQKLQVYVVLKGRNTAISCPNGDVFFNSSGNPGMAKGGSGDALAGILTGLLAQGYTPKETAILGVYLHGLAGDIAAEKLGYKGMIASDIIDNIPHAYKRLIKPTLCIGTL